jgi:VTC domain
MMRLEYKYIVPIHKIESLRKQILPFVEYDPYSIVDESRQYTVKSIYLDTKKFKDYNDKREGIYKRKKIRIRGYNRTTNDSKIFLEIKKKIGSHIYKNRSRILFSELKDFLKNKDLDSLASDTSRSDAENFLYYYVKGSLNLVTLVTYEREAFFSKFDKSLRITFDKNIRYKKAESCDVLFSDDADIIDSDFFILEIKFSKGFPDWLQKILQSQNLKRQSFSKYTTSVEEIINLTSASDSRHRENYV